MAKYRRKGPRAKDRRGWCELWGVVLIVGAALCWLAVRHAESAGAVGPVVRNALYLLFGRAAVLAWVAPLAAGLWMAVRGVPVPRNSRVYGLLAASWLALIVLHLQAPAGEALTVVSWRTFGGWFGAMGAHLFSLLFGRDGRVVVIAGCSLVAVLAILGLSIARAAGMAVGAVTWLFKSLVSQVAEFASGLRRVGGAPQASKPSFKEAGNGRLVRTEESRKRRRAAADADGDADDNVDANAVNAAEALPIAPAPGDRSTGGRAGDALRAGRALAAVPGSGATSSTSAGAGSEAAVAASAAQLNASGVLSPPPLSLAGPPRVAIESYALPPLTLLNRGPRNRTGRAAQDAETRAQLLEETFASFGVQVKVMEINPGPTVTRFEVRPAPGVKVARIEALADDVALSLAAADVRIAPIPGKGLVGVEVPNVEVSVVHLREILESAEFARAKSRLTFALGKDIAGQVILADLERLLHLLIAGATGSGKSVCLNALIASILFKARPDEVKLLLIDPKVVELQVYDGIPHLLAPVINDPKKASQILRWAVKEMLDRYYRFSEVGVRNIADYNRLMEERRECKEGRAQAPSGHAATAAGGTGFPLPRIIIVIDELADLMMVSPVEVEDSIWRLAQMARAAGIHLVVATQRPSVNVITGVIKANIPSRVAFAVASQVDSRTILDSAGADKLLGRGDMLFYPVGAAKPIRAQGALITDREVEELVKYVKGQADPAYMESFPVADDVGHDASRELDSRWGDALRVVFENGQASTSMLQRRLRIGYTRAARIVDMMEEMGIVAKSDGVKPRDVLMSIDQYTERYGPLDADPQDLRL